MLLFFLLFIPLFVLILLGVNMLVATNNPDTAKMAPYECGMPPASDARHKFQISFFLVAILFLIFDLEILFLYPLAVTLYYISFFGFWVAMVFILLLTVGFIAELASGALDYAKHRTTSSPSQNSPSAKVPNGIRSYSTSSSSDNPSNITSKGKRRRDLGNPKYANQYKANLTLTPFQVEVLVGLLLGYGCLSSHKSKKIGGHVLSIRHSMYQYDYIQHLHELFKDFVVQPILKGSTLDSRTKKTYFWCNLHTLSFKCFAYYRTLFYNEAGVKIIPANIDKLLTPIGLAYWYMDDGFYHKASGGFYLSTNSFTLAEVELLVEVLKTNFDLDCKSHKSALKDQRTIFISTSQSNKLLTLVHPYFHNSLLYKLGSN
jgi:NADH-ubiquinone oxidoreductase chain 3